MDYLLATGVFFYMSYIQNAIDPKNPIIAIEEKTSRTQTESTFRVTNKATSDTIRQSHFKVFQKRLRSCFGTLVPLEVEPRQNSKGCYCRPAEGEPGLIPVVERRDVACEGEHDTPEP